MSLLAELKRRNVFRVAFGYVVLAWLMAQVAELLLDAFGAPGWVLKSVLGLFVLGFPFVVFFAWAFEMTPEGIKPERQVDRGQSITRHTGRRLDRAIIVLLALAVAWFAWDRFQPPESVEPSVATIAPPPAQQIPDPNPTIPVIAVLPFKAVGSDDGGFLAAGLHDDLLTRLAKLDAFRVISRTSMMEYANTTKNMREIGSELGAGYILEGGVQARGDRVRINAQLIDAPADQHLWAEVYTRDLTATDLFEIQAELALAIAEQTHTVLSPADEAFVQSLPTDNTAAYNAYLRGLQLDAERGFVGESARAQVEAFEEAVRHDPGFALAWAHLASARAKLYQAPADPASHEAVLEAVEQARELQPGLLEAEVARAEYLYRMKHEYQQALDALIALGERASVNFDAVSMKAFLYRRLGRFQEAYETLEAATRLEPRQAGQWANLAQYAILVDRCEAAAGHIKNALSLAPEAPDIRTHAAMYEMECNGNARRAVELMRDTKFLVFDSWRVAFDAAWTLRDANRAIEIVENFPDQENELTPTFMLISRAEIALELEHDELKANALLDQAEAQLDAFALDPEIAGAGAFAGAKAFFHSLRRDQQATLHWVAQDRHRSHEEWKGDRAYAQSRRLFYAFNLAHAGLYDDAVEELRAMLETPGGSRFPYFNGFPCFDALQEHPGYVELRRRFGEAG